MKILRGTPKPLAVFATSDLLALRVMAAGIDAGLLVPEDVAIMGCHNDQLECESAPIPLTSVETNEEMIGYAGAAALDSLMSRAKRAKGPVVIPSGGVVARQSTDIYAVAHPAVRRTLVFMRDSSAKNIKTSDLVGVAGMSRRGLEKAFLQHLGRLPMQELRRLRFEAAQRLLRETDMKISAVASETGYRSGNTLGIVFRRTCGTSPRKWRRQNAAMRVDLAGAG